MFVIEVIPLSRTAFTESLSYYSAKEYPLGACINVPVRSRTIQAVVIKTEPVSAAKTALRAATFSLKKLQEQHDHAQLPESIMKTAKRLTDTLPATLGSVLFALLPLDIRNGSRPYPPTTVVYGNEQIAPTVLSGTRQSRLISYKGSIRQSFAHRGSVLFVVPTSAAVERARQELESGIEKRVITFASTHSKKRIAQSYEQFADLSTAKLIIVTPHFAFLDRHDITTIIIDEAGSAHYKDRTRPYLDTRDALRTHAAITRRGLILGDILLRTEEEALRRDDMYATLDEPTKRLSFGSTFTVAQHPDYSASNEFSLLTEELHEAIDRTIHNKGHAFLFAARRGLAPLIYCYDCGHIFRCPDSGAPYSLYESGHGDNLERWFVSPTSGRRVRAADVCPNCGSWRLKEQGIGIQQIDQYVRHHFKTASVYVFDHTTVTTSQKAVKLQEQFYKTKGSILIGTAMALPYLDEPVNLTAITSYEAARAIPTWRAEETLLRTLLTLREATSHECIVQTRSEPDTLLKYAARGLVEDFYNEEIEMRRALSYPPFSHFVLLTWVGSPKQVKETETIIEKTLGGVEMHGYNSPLPTKHGIIRHGLIRVAKNQWPDRTLMQKLRTLPPSIRLEVDPDRII